MPAGCPFVVTDAGSGRSEWFAGLVVEGPVVFVHEHDFAAAGDAHPGRVYAETSASLLVRLP
jgi:hypothetical protein